MPTYTPDQIGIELTPAAFRNLFNGTKGGLFASVRNYVSNDGEIATHCFQIAVDYGKVVKRSVEIIDAWLAQGCIAKVETVAVKYDTYVDASGMEYNRGKKGERSEAFKSLTLDASDALVIIALRELRAELTKPADEKKQGAQYDKNAKSIYSLDRADGEQHVYLRDCLTVGKTVSVEGEYEKTFTTAPVAIRKAVKRLLPVGKYRQFNLTRFDSLTLGGVSVAVDSAGNAYAIEPDLAKDLELNEIAQDVTGEHTLADAQEVAAQ